MEVMRHFDFFDEDIVKVNMNCNDEVREIVLSENNEKSIMIHKQDVIALAKEFDLFVFEKDSRL